MKETDGDFGDWKACNNTVCKVCNSDNIVYRSWSSHCGGYEDDKFKCLNCLHMWWIDGPDV